ncbi:MAG: lysophospholipase [Ponticaulis sp.]|nr:lysophospholipase [Ponticaulis sp.]
MIHMIKLCVGAESVDDLAQWQAMRIAEARARALPPYPVHETRMTPKRGDELVDGGSLYWVIKGVVLVRQKFVAVNQLQDVYGKSYCELVLDPELVRTEPQGRKAFQGWRYLKPEDAPADISEGPAADIPEDLGRALRDAGVW